MAAALDRLSAFGLDALLSATVWLCLWLPLLVLIRQPVRRRLVSLVAGLGSLAIPVLMGLEIVPQTPIAGFLGSLVPPGLGLTVPSLMHARGIGRVLVVAYGVGLVGQVGRWLLGWWGGSRLVRGSSAPSFGTAGLYTWLTRDLGRVPRLRVSTRLRGPVLIGVFRPVVLIPTMLDRAAHRESLRLVLFHELAHFQRRDPLVGLAAELSRAVWFCLPPVWWFGAQLRLDQEFLADRDAAARFGSRERYAAALFERAGPQADRERSGRLLGSAWIGGPALYQRMRVLLRCPFALEAIAPAWFRAVLVVLGVPLAWCLSGVSWKGDVLVGVSSSSGETPYTLHRLRIGPQAVPQRETLPLPLGPDFDLSADFVAESPADLRGARLAGYPLPEFDTESPEGRYSVHLSRRAGQARWRLGDRERPAGSSDDPNAAWLTVTAPPHRPIEVRNLVLKEPDSRERPAGRPRPAPSPSIRNSLP